jgi:two-component system sensor histidine kinase KdpD
LKIRRSLTVPAALAIVCLVTVVLRAIQAHVNGTTVGLVYLITILIVATTWGIVESVIASMLAALFFSFFSESPAGFAIVDPEDWVAPWGISHRRSDRRRPLESRATPRR